MRWAGLGGALTGSLIGVSGAGYRGSPPRPLIRGERGLVLLQLEAGCADVVRLAH